jgi:hypothetical protein
MPVPTDPRTPQQRREIADRIHDLNEQARRFGA